MQSSFPSVDVEPPSVDPGGFSADGLVDTVAGFVIDHPVAVVCLLAAIVMTKWLTKPLMKGIILGCLIAAVVFYALGG